ncbi:hypothetical protein [Kaarinaea lacus]
MEIFVISFLVFIIVSAALAIGLMSGRGPVHGGCRPDSSKGSCAEKGSCTLRCAKRRKQSTIQEI